MAKSKNKLSYISVPSQIITSLSSASLQSLLLSPKKPSKSPIRLFFSNPRSPKLWFFFLFLFSFLGMARIGFLPSPPCSITYPRRPPISTVDSVLTGPSIGRDGGEAEFWKQPDGMGYRPCLDFSKEYRRSSKVVAREKMKYLMVVVSGGLNQQRNQIIDAVIIARILGAALVVPILQVNVIWGDESNWTRIALSQEVRAFRSYVGPIEMFVRNPLHPSVLPDHVLT